MRQISAINNKPKRTKRTVKFRPLSESGIAKFKDWLKELSWEKLYLAKNIHQKSEILQETLITALNKFLPEKYVTFCSDDQTLITAELKELDRKRKRESKKKNIEKVKNGLVSSFCRHGKSKRKSLASMY